MVELWADSIGHGCDLTALYRGRAWPAREISHYTYRSLDLPGPHRAGARFPEAIDAKRIGVRWFRGAVPSAYGLFVERGDEVIALGADGVVTGGPITGYFIEQAAGAGPSQHPRVMRLEALWPELDFEAPLHAVYGDERFAPAVPGPLDASDLDAIDVWIPAPTKHLELGATQIGSVGAPATLGPWWAEVDPGVEVRQRSVSGGGLSGGLTRLGLGFAEPVEGWLRLPLPRPWPFPLLVELLGFDPPEPGECPVWTPPPPTPRHAAALGERGGWARVGLAPDGRLELQPAGAPHAGSHALCLHLAFAGNPPSRYDPKTWSASWALPEGEARAVVRDEHLELEIDGPAALGLALADGLWPLPLDPALLDWDGELIEAPGELRLKCARGRLRIALASERPRADAARLVMDSAAPLPDQATSPATPVVAPSRPLPDEAPFDFQAAGRSSASPGPVETCGFDFHLPNRKWNRRARHLLSVADLFSEPDGRMTYGVFPSVYAGDVFGLEEDYLLFALACWGRPRFALRGLRATYLTEQHLDKAHYLHDLRNGLTPWQTERILRLAGLGFDALDPDEQARLIALGDWVMARRQTSTEDRFEGLLPTYRFGGDLDLPSQSVYTDALNCVGLQSLAALTGSGPITKGSLRGASPSGASGSGARPQEKPEDRFAEDAAAYRQVIDFAFADLLEGDFQALHTGTGDPGDYYQLMAAGILSPVGYFQPGDARPARIAATLETQDRLLRGLPRFDEWGCGGRGVDPHYAVGYLWEALELGRREVFWEGLDALWSLGADPARVSFREVGPAEWPVPPWAEARVPGRRLGQGAPCVGGVGATLQLLRAAIVQEQRGPDGRPDGSLRMLGGIPDAWWHGRLRFGPAPTWGGPLTLEAWAEADVICVEVEGPGGLVLAGAEPVRVAAGKHSLRIPRCKPGGD